MFHSFKLHQDKITNIVYHRTGLPLRFYQPLHQSQLAFLPSWEYRVQRKEQENAARGQLLASQITQQLRQISPPPLRSTTPPHEGTSEDLGTGNAWDVTAPDPPDSAVTHWSRHPALSQRELRGQCTRKISTSEDQIGMFW